MNNKKKLIEVGLPLEAISRASGKEKPSRGGHTSALPLAACRVALFSSIVDDPSSNPEKFPTEEAQQAERQRLLQVVEDLVEPENATNEQVLKAVRSEMCESLGTPTPPCPPPVQGIPGLYEVACDFECYDNHKSDELWQIAERVLGLYEKTGKWQGSVEDLKCTIFMMQRTAHHTGDDPRGQALERFQSLYDTIRERWDEMVELPPLLAPFFDVDLNPLATLEPGFKADKD